MHVFEMKNLPRQADKAHLVWDSKISIPERNRDLIMLPNNPLANYYPLRKGKQFLMENGGGLWFGGTDEEPFLVQLQAKAIERFVSSYGSYEAFYEDLVPSNVRNMSTETGAPYKRQGDIFATRFCEGSYFEKRLSSLFNVDMKRDEFQIFGTRHVGKGLVLSLERNPALLFRGVVEAPDHAPLCLNDGLYLLGQTRYIVNPQAAD